MKEQIESPSTPQEELRVVWHSGREFIDFAAIKAHRSHSEVLRVCTMEIRVDGRNAYYYPLLSWPIEDDDCFVLEYKDSGEFEDGESAEGDLGTATYQYNEGEWTCWWKYAEEGWPVVKRKCKVLDPNKQRELELVKRARRDRAFRNMILEADGNVCVVTFEKLLCLLDAAHIHEVQNAGQDTRFNGITLRKDLHKLFDERLMQINSVDGSIWFDPKVDASYHKLFGEAKVSAKTLSRIRDNLLIRNNILKSTPVAARR